MFKVMESGSVVFFKSDFPEPEFSSKCYEAFIFNQPNNN